MLTPWSLAHTGCGKFFEGSAAEMHEALNKRLAALPDDTVVYVSLRALTQEAGADCEDTSPSAGPRVHKVQRQVCRVGAAERRRQEAARLCGKQRRDDGQVHNWRRKGACPPLRSTWTRAMLMGQGRSTTSL